MAGARPDLFKWNRRTKSSSSYSKNSVQSWIKNVQRASDDAAREVFGGDYRNVLDQVHVDEDALVEAQELLDKWTQDKQLQNIAPELEFYDEKWTKQSPKPRHVAAQRNRDGESEFSLTEDGRIETGGLLDDSDYYGLGDTQQVQPRPGADYEEGLDDEISVQMVVRNMLDKQVVENDILSDLGFDEGKKRRDPRPKMELRHKQVKEKSENRRREEEKSRRERSARKEAELLARRQIHQEERERQMKVRREEQLVQQEMMRIRRAMENEKKVNKDQMQREQVKLAEAEAMARQYMAEEQRYKEHHRRQEQESREEMRQLLLKQMEENAMAEAKLNLQALRRHFSAWYSVVIEQRIKFGKSSALADWRCKLRAWNAWRTYIWHIKSDKEARAIATDMKERHRKQQLADKFRRRHVLQRCMVAWQRFVHELEQNRKLQDEHHRKTNKMAALLEAAASGRLWSKQDEEPEEQEMALEDVDAADSRPSTARKVDEIFSQGSRKVTKPVLDRSSVGENRSEATQKRDIALLPNKPLRQAWGNKQTPRGAQSPRGQSFVQSPGRHASKPMDNSRKPIKKQRTLSAATKVSDLRSRLKEATNRPPAEKTLARSRSVDMLDSRGVSTDRVMDFSDVNQIMDNQLDFMVDLETDMTATSSKLLSREATVKSDKPKTTPLQLAMEERAKERATRKALIDARKRKLEEEKLVKLKQEQERKEAELAKEKQKILKKKREEKRLVRERELEKQRRIEEVRLLNEKAEQHYCQTLLLRYGLSPWRQLVAMAHENMSSAIEHNSQALVITCFYPWLQFARENKRRNEEAADQLFRNILIRRSWRSWRKYGQHMVRLDGVATDYCSSYMLKRYFRQWQGYVTDEQILYWEKERRADEHNLCRLQKLAMTYWKKLIPMKQMERKRETRRLEMRSRVKAWLPDFQGTGQQSSP